ncbi:hypothetical protein [Pontibacter sp. HJ8]
MCLTAGVELSCKAGIGIGIGIAIPSSKEPELAGEKRMELMLHPSERIINYGV